MSTLVATTASSRPAACMDASEARRLREISGRGKREEFPSSRHRARTHIMKATRTGGGVVLLVRDS